MRGPSYTSQVSYELQTPCLLQTRPPIGPDHIIEPGGSFESFRAFELAQDSTERERKSLAKRRMYRTIAPWTSENPILMHVRSADPQAVRAAIDQCAEVGFEMVIMTFGSGFEFESRDKNYQSRLKELADYGMSKGVALGGYSLGASRGAGTPADNVQGGKPTFGVAPCLCSKWGNEYLEQLRSMMKKGLLMIHNPLETEVIKTLRVPLYYTGKTTTASIREREGKEVTFKLDREYNVELPVKIPARGAAWFVIE